MTLPLLGAIESGGTKFVLALGRGDGTILEQARIETRGPRETINAALDWFGRQDPVAALGIASFGPVELDPASPKWGHIVRTPKPVWSDTDIVGQFGRALGVPVGFDTDVNGAAIGEHRWGAMRGLSNAVYLTIGTGIGGGAIINGKPVRGRSHPEMGHMPLPRHPDDQNFKAFCPYHDNCAEGFVSGPAIMRRWGSELSDLPDSHPGHAIAAWYIARLCLALVAVLAPQRIVLGGGVMQTPGLLDRVRIALDEAGAGYFGTGLAQLPVAPDLAAQSGVMGALALADDALRGTGR